MFSIIYLSHIYGVKYIFYFLIIKIEAYYNTILTFEGIQNHVYSKVLGRRALAGVLTILSSPFPVCAHLCFCTHVCMYGCLLVLMCVLLLLWVSVKRILGHVPFRILISLGNASQSSSSLASTNY